MTAETTVHIVAHSSMERAEQARICYSLGYHAEIYSNYDELLLAAPYRGLVLSEDIADRGGIEALIAGMSEHGFWLPVIATARDVDPHRVVSAIRSGALDYLPWPLNYERLSAALEAAAAEAQTIGASRREAVQARARLAALTARERDVLSLLVAGSSNKVIARELQISPRTVEIHRANMMAKLGAHHAADAVRLWLEAATGRGSGSVAPSASRAQHG